MSIPLRARLQALIARDKDEFWWKFFTDEERELREKTVWELAKIIEDSRVQVGQEQRRIVAEHLINVRLAQIQAKASWGSGMLGFVGAIIGAALSVALTGVFFQGAGASSAATLECKSLPPALQAHGAESHPSKPAPPAASAGSVPSAGGKLAPNPTLLPTASGRS